MELAARDEEDADMTKTIKPWPRAIAIGGALVLAVLALDAGSPADAYWCANYQTGGTNCGFSRFDQCQASLSGNGGSCNEIRTGAPDREAARPIPRRPREEVAKPRRAADRKPRGLLQLRHLRPRQGP
jgi:uncharacterized protein DUF3551